MTCKKAQGYLADNDVTVAETVNAKAKWGPEEALRLARGAAEVIVAKGSKVVRLAMANDRPDDKTLLKHMLGPTGNLRAPVVRKGKTLLVGFNREAYDEVLRPSE